MPTNWRLPIAISRGLVAIFANLVWGSSMPTNQTAEHLTDCPRCGGSGKITALPTCVFKAGDKVWWKAARNLWWYGWGEEPVPSDVVRVSATGKRVYIRFRDRRHNYDAHLYIEPRFLEPRYD